MIGEIATAIPPGVASFLLTSKRDVVSIIAQQRRCKVNTIQLVDHRESGSDQDLRDAMPGIAIVQVVHVVGEESIKEAVEVAPQVDAILLEPVFACKGIGGHGANARLEPQPKDSGTRERPGLLSGRSSRRQRRRGDSAGQTVCR